MKKTVSVERQLLVIIKAKKHRRPFSLEKTSCV